MSRKEEQRKIKEAKQAAAKRKRKINSLLLKAAVVIVIPVALYVFYQGLFSGPPALPPGQVAETDHIKGAEDAAVTITIYADFQCPSCLSEVELIVRAWPQISQQVRLVFRHFPLDTHRFAFLAARYAEAAARQGKFWQMHDQLFANQQLWSTLQDAVPEFDSYALQMGLDMEQLKADMELPEVRAKILADQQGGIRAGVRSTPAMFINGKLVANPRTSGELIEMVREAE